MKDLFDVAIVGGGPAGCFAAFGVLGCNPNAKVAIIEKDYPPLPKVGEALLTGTIYTFEQAGLVEKVAQQGYLRKIGAAYQWGKSKAPWYVPFNPRKDYPKEFCYERGRQAIHVPRHHFDKFLLDEAVERGAKLIQQPVIEVTSKDDVVTAVRTKDQNKVFAKYWIDASGQAAILAKHLSVRKPLARDRVARRGYFVVDWEKAKHKGFFPNHTNILQSELGWMWAIHLGEKGNNLTSIGFVSNEEIANFFNCKTANKLLPELEEIFGINLQHQQVKNVYGEEIEEFIAQPKWSFYTEKQHGKNWAVVGDASAFLDPILSQGVTLACNYGLLRGQAAFQWLKGVHEVQEKISSLYQVDINFLQKVVTEWYNSDSSVEDWKLKVSVITNEELKQNMSPEQAFQWLTNLEHYQDHCYPYPFEDMKIYQRHMGTTLGYVESK